MLQLTLQMRYDRIGYDDKPQEVKQIRIIYDGISIEKGVSVTDWAAFAKGALRAEMQRKRMSYSDLVKALDETGVKESEANLRNKVSRGSFSAAFLFQCLSAMGVRTLHLD